MIYDKLENAAQYRGISRRLDAAIDCMLAADFGAVAEGRYAIDGDDVYYMVQAPQLKAAGDTAWEAHRRYIDIQMALSDGEGIGYAPLDGIDGWGAYDDAKDIVRAAPGVPGVMLPLRAGTFAILFPQDAHRPCERIGEAEAGHKVVFKVRV